MVKSKCYIASSTKYGLFDDSGSLRGTGYDIEDIVELKQDFGWGTIRKIKVTNNGITYGEEVD